MYLFDLNMSNIKSEPLAQECFKSKVFLKISRTDLKTTVRGSLFYNKDAECIKLLRASYTRYRYFPVKFAKFVKTPLKTPSIL